MGIPMPRRPHRDAVSTFGSTKMKHTQIIYIPDLDVIVITLQVVWDTNNRLHFDQAFDTEFYSKTGE